MMPPSALHQADRSATQLRDAFSMWGADLVCKEHVP